MSRLLLAVAAAAALACAAPKPVEKMPASEAFGPALSSKIDPARADVTLGTPKEWAKQWHRDIECERGARTLESHYGHEVAWTYLKACITKGGFLELETLCDNWADDLRTRPEARTLLMQVMASRGGNVGADVRIIQKQRISLFELTAAMKQVATFKGRYLVVIGRVAEARVVKGKAELILMELASQQDVWWRQGAYGQVEERVSSSFQETGQEIVVKMKEPDPFLRIEKRHIFLVRFDGTGTPTEYTGDDSRVVALVTLISYRDL